MLVLSRKQNQRLVIDGNIVITIVQISGSSVRIGIEAPADVGIRREELLGVIRENVGPSKLCSRVA